LRRNIDNASIEPEQFDLDHNRLKAPFDGLVLATHLVPGQTIASALQPPVLVVIAKANRYRVRCWMSVAALEHVQPGYRVNVSVDGGSYTGDTQAVGLESRVVEPGGNLQFALDIMLSVQKKLPVGSRVTVELP
jgi:multidrug resistance efflux pump